MTAPGRPPQYPRIASELRKRIYDGAYRPYEKLPGTRALAKEFGVSQHTMLHALGVLKNEGLTFPGGMGIFVTGFAALGDEEMMTSRSVLNSFCIPDAVVVDILFMHAHELAEKQRAWLAAEGYAMDCACGGCTVCIARDYINLIDPDKEAP